MRLDVLFSYQGNDMYSAVQIAVQGIGAGDDAVKQSAYTASGVAGVIFAILATLYVVRIMLDLFLTQRFMLAWRAWLTDRLTGDWLDGHAYYRTRFIDDTIDNPDQRIQSDIDIFTAGVGPLPNTPNNTTEQHPAVRRGQCRRLGDLVHRDPVEPVRRLTMFGFTMPRAMFWIGFVYVLVATIIAFWIGRPIIRLSFDNEKFNAAFRYALVRLRDAAEAVAFYRGEAAERLQLRQRFAPDRRQLQAATSTG